MEIKIAPDSTVPLHMQLLNQLRHLILSGQWEPGSRLPSETKLQRRLKISRSTIRQALNNAEAEGLIERVPGRGTFVARLPASGGNSHLIGYMTVDLLSSHFQYQLLRGAESAARARDYRILFCSSGRSVQEESRLLDQLLQDKIGGLLIWPFLSDDPDRGLRQLADRGLIPLVLIDRPLSNAACDYVASDSFSGAYSAVKHLVNLGHRRIAFLSQSILELRPIAKRLQGYQEAMQKAGLPPLEPWLVGRSGQELGTSYALHAYSSAAAPEIEQIARLLETPQRPTAIFAINDLTAMLTLKAAALAGLRVPQDLSVVGFDDMDFVAHLDVPLTTVAQDTFAMGQRAAELLIERIEGYNGPPRQEILPAQLKVRASTAAPESAQAPEIVTQSAT